MNDLRDLMKFDASYMRRCSLDREYGNSSVFNRSKHDNANTGDQT